MPYLSRDGLVFHERDQGAGLPFVFQHGQFEQPRAGS